MPGKAIDVHDMLPKQPDSPAPGARAYQHLWSLLCHDEVDIVIKSLLVLRACAMSQVRKSCLTSSIGATLKKLWRCSCARWSIQNRRIPTQCSLLLPLPVLSPQQQVVSAWMHHQLGNSDLCNVTAETRPEDRRTGAARTAGDARLFDRGA